MFGRVLHTPPLHVQCADPEWGGAAGGQADAPPSPSPHPPFQPCQFSFAKPTLSNPLEQLIGPQQKKKKGPVRGRFSDTSDSEPEARPHGAPESPSARSAFLGTKPVPRRQRPLWSRRRQSHCVLSQRSGDPSSGLAHTHRWGGPGGRPVPSGRTTSGRALPPGGRDPGTRQSWRAPADSHSGRTGPADSEPPHCGCGHPRRLTTHLVQTSHLLPCRAQLRLCRWQFSHRRGFALNAPPHLPQVSPAEREAPTASLPLGWRG